MTRMRKAMAALAAVTLIGPAAVIAATGPASADADGKHRHDLDTYKKEMWVELGGTNAPATKSIDFSCDPNDIVLDGMWKVDAHDGDDRSVVADGSYSAAASPSTWHFDLRNTAAAQRAQMKLFITCLDHRTGAAEKHFHTLTWRDLSAVTAPVTAGTSSTPTMSCDTGEIPVAPGFSVALGATAQPYKSYPTATLRGWSWTFWNATAGEQTTYLRCVASVTANTIHHLAGSTATAHTHDIDADLVPSVGGQSFTLTSGQSVERSVRSRPHDEGNVGAYEILDGGHVWYLGQDAQGQVRTTRFWYDGTAGAGGVKLAVWGFDKRTKKNS